MKKLATLITLITVGTAGYAGDFELNVHLGNLLRHRTRRVVRKVVTPGSSHRHSHQTKVTWVKGQYRTETRREWQEGRWETVRVSAKYDWCVSRHGRRVWTKVQDAYCYRSYVRGCWVEDSVQVWAPGHAQKVSTHSGSCRRGCEDSDTVAVCDRRHD